MAPASRTDPSYLAKHGTLLTPDELDGHRMIGFVSSRTGQPLPLEFTRDGSVIEVALPARVLVGGADTSAAAVRLGLGLSQANWMLISRPAVAVSAGRMNVEVRNVSPVRVNSASNEWL